MAWLIAHSSQASGAGVAENLKLFVNTQAAVYLRVTPYRGRDGDQAFIDIVFPSESILVKFHPDGRLIRSVQEAEYLIEAWTIAPQTGYWDTRDPFRRV